VLGVVGVKSVACVQKKLFLLSSSRQRFHNEYLLKNVDNLKCSTIKAMQFTSAAEHKIRRKKWRYSMKNSRGQEKWDKIVKIQEFDNLPNSPVQPWGRNMQSNICKNLPQQPANVQQPTTSEFVKGSPSKNDHEFVDHRTGDTTAAKQSTMTNLSCWVCTSSILYLNFKHGWIR